MEEKLSIKINIGDRFYPLKIEREDEEKIRKAAAIINDKINQYKQKYSDKDHFDFLAMASLQFALKSIESDASEQVDAFKNEVNTLNENMEKYIRENI
jgi:cell division protein ZapA